MRSCSCRFLVVRVRRRFVGNIVLEACRLSYCVSCLSVRLIACVCWLEKGESVLS